MENLAKLYGFLLCWVPCLAAAQILDFDAVCPAPPCPIGTRYAVSGVSFSPSTSPIVASGTNGLTGPVGGGKYLSVAAFPYQLTVSLGRPATYFDLQLSRGTSSSAPVSVSLTWVKAGVPVDNTTVLLSQVNVWTTVGRQVPGGFDSLFINATGGANASYGVDGIQLGGTCNGFADVQPTDVFCNATEWLANREITAGCAAGQYCPSLNVTRGQMALFMQRLGRALAPTFVRANEGGGNVLNPSVIICRSEAIPVSSSPRYVWAQAIVEMQAFNAATPVEVGIVASGDGTTWFSAGFRKSGYGVPGETISIPASLLLPIGKESLIFAVRVAASIPQSVGYVGCELIAQVTTDGRATTAPLDSGHFSLP